MIHDDHDIERLQGEILTLVLHAPAYPAITALLAVMGELMRLAVGHDPWARPDLLALIEQLKTHVVDAVATTSRTH